MSCSHQSVARIPGHFFICLPSFIMTTLKQSTLQAEPNLGNFIAAARTFATPPFKDRLYCDRIFLLALCRCHKGKQCHYADVTRENNHDEQSGGKNRF